jgi:hypothetical protein
MGYSPVRNRSLIWIALAVRVLLLAWAVPKGHWRLADTQPYLDTAELVCSGQWGGDLPRTPMFAWFLCATSFGGVTLALILQSLLTWALGVWLSRGPTRFHQAAAIICFFDPVLLAYSQLVMSDSIFAVLIFFMSLQLNNIILVGQKARLRDAALLGLLFAAVILQRPIGEPVVAVTLVFLGVIVLLKRAKMADFFVVLVVTAALLFPRLYWVHEHAGKWTLAGQGSTYILATAGAVEYAHTGIELYQAQRKWYAQYPNATEAFAIQTILRDIPAFAWLSLKGAARVLIGHVNVEWAYILTGKSVVGPGWFKIKNPIEGAIQIEGLRLTALWCLGLLWTFAFCSWEYWLVFRRVFRASDAAPWGKPNRLLVIWAVIVIAALIAAPQMWGDARFRAPILAILMALLVCRAPTSIDRA